MAINDIRGMVHEYPDFFEVGREKVREYAKAVKADDPASFAEAAAAELGHPALVAPLTFVSTVALIVQQDIFSKVDVGLETMQIVQVDQRFVYHKPILAGDKLWARMEVVSVNERFGADIVVTRNSDWQAAGVLRASSLEEALHAGAQHGDTVWVMGGAQIYAQALPLADVVEVTIIHKDFEGDAFAPELGPEWVEGERQDLISAKGLPFSFVRFTRKR